MRAAIIDQYGGNEVITFNFEHPAPALQNGQILVEVLAASLSPFDRSIQNGALQDKIALPLTLGGDFAGIVTKVTPEVTGFTVGDMVYGSASVVHGGSGSFAELSTANGFHVAQKPTSLDFIEAASLSLAGANAIQAIEDTIHLEPNQKILIHGGTGGIGSIAIQLAKYHGAYVITTVRGDHYEFAKELGADQVINNESEDFTQFFKDLDAVFDTVGGDITNRSIQVLKRGGALVTMAGEPDYELAKLSGISAIVQHTNANTERLNRLSELVDRGAIKPQIDRIFPLEYIKEALEYYENHHPKGKVVIAIK